MQWFNIETLGSCSWKQLEICHKTSCKIFLVTRNMVRNSPIALLQTPRFGCHKLAVKCCHGHKNYLVKTVHLGVVTKQKKLRGKGRGEADKCEERWRCGRQRKKNKRQNQLGKVDLKPYLLQ